MSRAHRLFIAIGCALCVAGCDRNSEAPTSPSTPAPVASTEAATAQPEAPGTTEASAAPGWRPSKCARYSFTPADCRGSAENPNCTDSFELHPDGKVDKLFDDIMASGSYESSGTTVTIRVPDMKFSETLTIEDDGKVLVSSKGARYQRSDCP